MTEQLPDTTPTHERPTPLSRILIVDDNPMNVDILQTRLASHGYETITAGDGEEALAVARAILYQSPQDLLGMKPPREDAP